MQGFLVGLILGAGAALGGLYYYGSFEVMDKEFGREMGTSDYAVEEAVVVEDTADAAAEDVVEDVADEAGDMADAVEGAIDEAADDAGDMADAVEEVVEDVAEEAGEE